MNALSELQTPKTRGQRILIAGLLLTAGALGVCWAGYKYASAASEANSRFAFLDQFERDKNQREAELAKLRKKAAEEAALEKQTHHKDFDRVNHRNKKSERGHIHRDDEYYAPNLEIDLSKEAIEDRLRRDTEYLSSDELEGRGIRTRGLELAGTYLAEQFDQAGLYSAWYNGTPFQEFQLLNGSRRGAVQRVVFNRQSGEKYLLTPNVDFSSLMKTTMGTMTLDVVFAGYGITAPELNYDDYKDVRVAGKAVVILRHQPRPRRNSQNFPEEEIARHAPVYNKIQNAIAHGASAVILCDRSPDIEPNDEDDPFSSDLFKVEFSEDAFDTTIPVIHCRQTLLDEVLHEYEGESLAEIEEHIDQKLQPKSRQIDGFQVGFEVTRNRSGRNVRNVLASIEPNGTMPEKTIIIGAHYDHLGRDGWGSLAVGADGEIHNGADDNASGTAVVMEVARQLASKRDELKCRILFIAFTAEELGLLGSKHYIRDPAVPLSQTMAMINLDMVGRLREELTIYGVGTAREWKDLISPAAEKESLNVQLKSSGYGPSDHAVFYEKGIPVLHFFTGFHPQYHRPSDDSPLLNISGMRKISNCVTEIVLELATEDSELTEGHNVSDQFFAEGAFEELLEQPDSGPPKLGVVVRRVADNEAGLVISKVLPQSIADRNGLRAGDIILKVGEDEISTVPELKESVSKHNSGDTIPFQVSRRNLTLEIDLTF